MIEQMNNYYEENFVSLLEDMDMQLDDDFWDSYDPEW